MDSFHGSGGDADFSAAEDVAVHEGPKSDGLYSRVLKILSSQNIGTDDPPSASEDQGQTVSGILEQNRG
jgi:hypothetical protein